MVSFDISSMFPSISKEHGLQACKGHLEKRIDPLFSTQCILDAISITLDNNITTFNGEYFRQIKGIAMGAKNACDYADISMTKLDHYIHEEDLKAKHGITPPIMFERFRDDIFALFTDEDSIGKCYDLLNSFYDNISFTKSNISSQGIEFLDTFVFMKNKQLVTKPYSKSCDSHCYLSPTSCHPTHILENIPYGIAHRIFKISSDGDIYNESKLEYTNYLKNRGYSESIILSSFEKAESLTRTDMIFREKAENRTPSSSSTPLVCDYNPALPPVGKYIHKYKHILQMDTSLTKIIDPNNLFTAHRANPTIKDMLVQSKLTIKEEKPDTKYLNEESGSIPCKKGCKVCKDFMVSPLTIESYHTDQQFKFKHILDCKSKFVIYKIDDKICKRCYVGSTAIGVSERWRNHKSHIRNNIKSCELSTHFSECNKHNFNKKTSLKDFDNELRKHLCITLIDTISFDADITNEDKRIQLLKIKEAFWQNQLKSLVIFGGLNKRDARKETKTKTYQRQN